LRFFSIDSSIAEGHENEGECGLSDFAVLCRLSRQFEALEKAFSDHSIPFQRVENVPFYSEKPLRYVLDFLKAALNPAQEFIVSELMEKKHIDAGEVARFGERNRGKPVRDMVVSIIESYFAEEKAASEPSFKNLVALADTFGAGVEEFLRNTSLSSGVDLFVRGAENVSLMTIHAAKGLEFRAVFIPGCEQGVIPYSLFEGQEADMEEERRLLYVGMTRAEKYLHLSYADTRRIFGTEYRLPKSGFLADIQQELIAFSKQEYSGRPAKECVQLSLF
jgi:superfamily I DNA/RNA helicase